MHTIVEEPFNDAPADGPAFIIISVLLIMTEPRKLHRGAITPPLLPLSRYNEDSLSRSLALSFSSPSSHSVLSVDVERKIVNECRRKCFS